MLDSTLNFDKGTPTAPDSRTSHFHSRDAQARNPPSRVLARHMEKAKASQGASMVDDLLNTLTRNDPLKASRPNASLSDIGSMIAPYSQNDHLTRDQPELESAPVKLGPTVGRTVNVNPARGMDVGRAFRQLEILCARNHVRKDVMRQRFHERPGLKRKRLKSERWRRNFKENFKGTVALVQKMRKQGW
ncbi:hypothetical protein PRZ48_010083 [Zasmidium cellare]|uniref:Ribosomal protein S21 n=1 Tax=Zasmidium cellare TaxID=395010 RepID=A0ABR0EE83_ZASCE|nr:hypothetical protein PRZ48_010083 [Zasmidium cellare]